MKKTRFIHDICQKGSDEVNKMLSIVSVQRSQCSKIDDQLCIFQLVQDKFHEINSEVFHLIRKWIIKTMKEELIHCSDHSINRSTLLFANATITYSFGLLNESEEYYKEYNRLHFDSLEHWLKGLNGLALLYRDQAKYQDAFELYNNGIREISEKLGPSHHLIVEARSQLAMLHRYCGNYKEAARILESCLIVMKENIGTSIQSFIENKLKYYLACVYSDDKKLHESEKLFLGCYEFNVHYFGENNPDTLAMMDDFALLYRRLQRYSDSVNIYERCVMKRKEKLGNDHPDTLASMSGLASVYSLQKRYDLALELACDTLMKRRTKLGYDHPVTINTYGNIGMIKFEASNGRCNCKVHCDYLFSDSIGNCGKYMIVEVIEELKRRNYPDDHTWILKFKKVLEKCIL